MKQKLIKIKSLLTISLVALLLYGCERDQEGIQNSQTTVSHKQFKELINQENFNRPVSQIQKKNEEFFEKAAMGKTAMEEEYGFTISDQLVNVVQNDTLTSYTMLITRDSIAPNEVENLIIQNTNTQNQNQAYIIKYDSNNLVSSVTPICYNANTTNRSGDECFTVAYWQCNYPGHTTDGICTHGNWVGVSVCIDGQGGGGGSSGSGNHGAGGGLGYGGGGAGTNGSIITSPVAPDYTSINLTTTLSLTQAQQDWLNMGSQSIIKKELQIYLFNNLVDTPNATNNAIAFTNWAVTYLMANPSVTIEEFKNWFMGTSEGLDGTYDATYWNNPNLTFPQQALPTYDDFYIAYPLHEDLRYNTPLGMYTEVGGEPLAIYNSSGNPNTCALRVSFGLNEAGITIPNIPGKTFKGADNKYYFLGAANLLAWMKKTFGTPTGSNYLTGAQGGLNGANFPALLTGKKGIYFMIPNSTAGFGASGHTDILYPDTTCDGGCYFDAQVGGVKEIFIFELP